MPASAAVQIKIVKGCRSLDIQKCTFSFPAEFSEIQDVGVKVRAPGMFHKQALFISGNRKRLPAFEAGEEYNLHTGDPTQNIRIQIIRKLD